MGDATGNVVVDMVKPPPVSLGSFPSFADLRVGDKAWFKFGLFAAPSLADDVPAGDEDVLAGDEIG